MKLLAAAGGMLVAVTASQPPFRLVPEFVSYRNHSSAGEETAITHMVGAGVCVLDFDGDGVWDLFFPDRNLPDSVSGSRLFRGSGLLAFDDVTSHAGSTTADGLSAAPWATSTTTATAIST